MIGYGILFKDKHSYKDFGISIKSKEIGIPTVNYVKDSVPFMQGEYDFTALYGDVPYGERVITYVFDIMDYSKEKMNYLKIAIVNWLKGSEKDILRDDAIRGYYFLAQASEHSFKEDGLIGELTIKFTCYPFKIGNEKEGEVLWDDFCFLTDVLQETKFYIEGYKKIKLYSISSRNIIPTIICDSDMKLRKKGIEYIIEKGTHKDNRFYLEQENEIEIIGTGTIQFDFKREVL